MAKIVIAQKVSTSAEDHAHEEALKVLLKACPVRLEKQGMAAGKGRPVFSYLFRGTVSKEQADAWLSPLLSEGGNKALKVAPPMNGWAFIGTYKEDVLVTVYCYPGNGSLTIYLSY